jgi:hypothetical protein
VLLDGNFLARFLDVLRAAPSSKVSLSADVSDSRGIAATVKIAAWLEFDILKDTIYINIL